MTKVIKSVLGGWFVMVDDEPVAGPFDTNAKAWRWYDRNMDEKEEARSVATAPSP